MLNDYPMFKYLVLGLMAFFTIIAKDPQWWYKITYNIKISFLFHYIENN
jgi:hypothetical protein